MRRAPVSTVLLLGAIACQPHAFESAAVCNSERLPPGEVFVGEITCTAMRVTSGEGRAADYWMANSLFRALIRHPQDSQTAVGVGGGTVVGPLLMGLSKPAQIVPMGATTADMVNMAALAAHGAR